MPAAVFQLSVSFSFALSLSVHIVGEFVRIYTKGNKQNKIIGQ